MKTTIVYYSKSGNTKLVSELLAENLQASALQLKLKKEIPQKGFWMYFLGGMGVVFKRKPKLLSYQFDKQSELVIIGSPIWASCFSSPIRTFLSENDLSGKKVAFFACNKGGGAGTSVEELKKLQPNCELVSTADFLEPKDDSDQAKHNKIINWVNEIKAK